MRIILPAFVLSCLLPVSGLALAAETERPELTQAEFSAGSGTLELSGIGRWRGKLVGVSDGKEDHFLYELAVKGNKLNLKRFVDLSKIAGYADYQKHLGSLTQFEEGSRRIDLEGVAVCGDDIYLINERVREVLLLSGGKKLERLAIDFGSVKDLMEGGANAGFEGIAADCAGKTLYVAKEREPRKIIVISMNDWKITDQFDVPASDRAGGQVINIFTGKGLMPLGADFADLHFDAGYLYALERNTYEIAKIDPKTKTVTARVSYFNHERGLYETGEPFGIAEALLLDGKALWVGFDNNQSPYTHKAQVEHGAKGVGEGLLRTYRPDGF